MKNKLREKQIKERDVKVEIIKELRSYGMTFAEVAGAMGITSQRVFQLCNEEKLKRDFSNIIKVVFKKYGYKK